LSAHANKSGLFDIIKKTNPEKVVCVHGDRCKEFAQEIKDMGIDAFAPKNNQTINV